MSRDLQALVPEFRTQVKELLRNLDSLGIEMRPYFTIRTPWQQARIWRSTRTTGEIYGAIQMLKSSDADYIAHVLDYVGPQFSDPGTRGHLTNALPGVSWHQWGQAVDCYWAVKNKAIWSTQEVIPLRSGDRSANGYKVYGEHAEAMGLTSAGLSWGWDWPHVQQPAMSSPLAHMSWKDVSEAMYKRYGSSEAS